MNALVMSIIVLPLVANLFLSRVRYASIGSAIVEVALVVVLRGEIPVIGTFYVTQFSWYILLSIASIYVLSAIYSLRYIGNQNRYYYFLNFFTSTMFFTVVVNNLGLMWVGIEATTVSSVLLVVTERTPLALEAGWRYVILVSAGVTFALASVILFYYGLGTLTVSSIETPHLSPLLTIASALALMGFGTKAGVFPMNTWLPDVHSEAPAPVSALFSGVLLPVAVYVLHVVYVAAPVPELYSWVAVISIGFASIAMGSQRFHKRLFAYSTIENMNLALLGMSANSTLGVAILLLSHAFGKAGAFYSCGSITRSTGKKEIDQINMPVTSAALLISSLSVTGLPPFGTFLGEFAIFSAAFRAGMFPQVALALVFTAVGFISINFHVGRMVLHEGKREKEDILLAATSLAAGLASLAVGLLLMRW
ncbi:NADH dehydrogenase [Sulfodiicoccus acidiphilus]|uniref:NADH dehydrogenase n=1 Tax=Sulfodiicoccus acidiphilus TaxID=1670455 RepID=A0A348B4U0_9CREN|nr:proton-conducting transporter membrane subunit [Sulfodiicoccus acidiphilus]BBD73192.1 NADH dehydrogenase [Sulfodiicoccus acidiphilus]GGU01407.1 NADH dehydrogenase [Sulfodiicoccus acidiphilus]